ncbi:hypothetical protein [Pseudomonas sp. A34-9]|uniref:hypothetical protein n=1 Tax=Pseudomonas sp. A34-9 TaxID=3034675 RepID=UPI00240E83D1|nr:hypothetical protein [Pseudomonas sp. A34-9]
MNSSIRSLQAAGTLDEQFAEAGIFRLSLPHLAPETLITGVEAEHSPQRLYFTGQARSSTTNRPYLLGRLLPDGTLDNSFGTGGVVSGSFSPGAPSLGKSISLLDDGKILLTGLVRLDGIPALARFFADGTLDLGFGNNGYVVLEHPEAVQAHRATAGAGLLSSVSATALANGKIVLVHNYVVAHSADTRAFIYLLDSVGALDTSFNQKGYVPVVYPGADPANVRLRSALLDADGKISVCGNLTAQSGSSAPLFARYQADGNLDAGFGDAGFVLVSTLQASAELNAVIAQPNKRLLGIGETDAAQGLLISLEPDGQPNIQFNRGQPLLTRLNDLDTLWQRGAMQPDGSIVMLGKIHRPKEQGEVAVARLLSDGSLDPTFNGAGWASTPLERSSTFDALTLQTDGKIVIAGSLAADFQGLVLRYHGRG